MHTVSFHSISFHLAQFCYMLYLFIAWFPLFLWKRNKTVSQSWPSLATLHFVQNLLFHYRFWGYYSSPLFYNSVFQSFFVAPFIKYVNIFAEITLFFCFMLWLQSSTGNCKVRSGFTIFFLCLLFLMFKFFLKECIYHTIAETLVF